VRRGKRRMARRRFGHGRERGILGDVTEMC
jgi:hypothetical protein